MRLYLTFQLIFFGFGLISFPFYIKFLPVFATMASLFSLFFGIVSNQHLPIGFAYFLFLGLLGFVFCKIFKDFKKDKKAKEKTFGLFVILIAINLFRYFITL